MRRPHRQPRNELRHAQYYTRRRTDSGRFRRADRNTDQSRFRCADARAGANRFQRADGRTARLRAREIASVFSHTRPDGSSCFTVSEKAYGENIAKGYGTVDKVMAAWMSSEGHRANILRASYGSIGVCCLQIDGVYYWVQLFGK